MQDKNRLKYSEFLDENLKYNELSREDKKENIKYEKSKSICKEHIIGEKKLVEDFKQEQCCCHHKNTEESALCEKKSIIRMGCCEMERGTTKETCCSAKNLKKDFSMKIIFLCISFVALILSRIDFWNLVGLKQISFLDFGYIAVILCGYPILLKAINGLRNKKITTHLLVSIAILSSIVLEIICRCTDIESSAHHHSYVFVAGEVAFLMMVGGLIEAWTIKSSRKGMERIMNMSPKTANVRVGKEIKTVKINEIKIGDIVVVRPNEMIPVDGEVVLGSSAVDQSSVTGEFVPIDVVVGSVVYAATWNKMGAIEVRTTKETKDMTVNKLIHLALEAEDKRAPIAKFVDKIASWIVPSIILVSIGIGFLSYYAFNLTWMQALIRSVTVLVVFCPCSLTLATPTAIAAGIGSGAYNGIIIKSGDALERLAKVDTIAFDKTGTITIGNIEVKEIIPFVGTKKDLIKLTASAEMYSEHPIGKAIVEYAKGKVKLVEPKNTRSQIGVGIKASIDGEKVGVISLKRAFEKYKDDSNLNQLKSYLDKGYTIIITEKNDKLLGGMCLYDTIRNDATQTMQKIRELNINTLMLTGDNIYSAQNIASKCEIDNVKASLMPEDKVKVVMDCKENGQNICMVGDGVNDAPALATADCSIALSAMGNDVAVETADIAIMNSDIKNIYNTIILSRKTLTTIKRNICISMSINCISLLLTFFGLLNPALGAIVHTSSSIFVVINSAFLLRTKYYKGEESLKRRK